MEKEQIETKEFCKRKKMGKIGVLTSGGDAPGMNAAIRAVTRAAIAHNLKVIGIRHGYQGMIEKDFIPMSARDVSGILHTGGTILKTARSLKFKTENGREQAFKNLKEAEIDAVVVIGGDGTFTGASIFTQEYDIPFIGIPGTIDNDLSGTDYTLGYDTAMNTVMEAADKIKDTANSHGRIFFIEVMGNKAGRLALNSGIAVGAEAILIPETNEQEKAMKNFLEKGYKEKDRSGLILVAEAGKPGRTIEIAKKVALDYPYLEVRVSILGHIQRGGSPTAKDRIVATRMGVAAIDALLDDQQSIMIGLIKHNEIVHVPFSKAIQKEKEIDQDLLRILKVINI